MQTRCRVHQMSRLASDAQQVHNVLSHPLLIQPVLCRPDAEYIRWPGLLVMLSRFTVFCLVFCLFGLSYADQLQCMSTSPPDSTGQHIQSVLPCDLSGVKYTPTLTWAVCSPVHGGFWESACSCLLQTCRCTIVVTLQTSWLDHTVCKHYWRCISPTIDSPCILSWVRFGFAWASCNWPSHTVYTL